MPGSCCSTSKGTCKRKDGKTFKMPRKFSRAKCRNPRGFTMRASCAPYRFCKGGSTKLPRLRPIDTKNKRYKYKLKDPQSKRILAINEGIKSEKKKKGNTLKKAAISKKARFNVLRIYRKNKKPDECRKITSDMKYIDKKYGLGNTNTICGGSIDKNVLDKPLQKCSTNPITGYNRDGYCKKNNNDMGSHLVCAKMNKKFLNFTKSKGNDLSSVVKKGDKWCLCQDRYYESVLNNKEPKVIKKSTSNLIKPNIKKHILKGGKNKRFLYNPNNPKKSFDVYVDKNPKDTIPIKYKTLEDVKKTIKKLERLYKNNKYTHKRIWQVAMIMKVRLESLRSKKPKEYNLSKRYYEFLKKRTKIKNELNRKKMIFNV